MKRTAIIFVLALMAWTGSRAQDVHFSQFNNTPLLTNPALTGAFNAEHRIILNYRNQWATIGKPYTTYAISYDLGLLKSQSLGFLGVGLQIYYDKAGDLNMGTIQANLSVAYHLAVNEKNRITAGIQGGYEQHTINTANGHWDSQYDPFATDGYNPTLPSGETSSFNSFGVGDFSAGLLWTFNNSPTNMSSNDMIKGNAGFALYHINQPSKTFDNLKKKEFIKYGLHSNFLFGVPNTNLAIVPSVLACFQGPAHEILLGSLFRFRLQEKSKYTNFVSETAISVGAHYRFGDAVIAEAMFEIKNWGIGVSYDVNTSKLTAASKSMGGVEVSLRYMTPIFKKSDKSLY